MKFIIKTRVKRYTGFFIVAAISCLIGVCVALLWIVRDSSKSKDFVSNVPLETVTGICNLVKEPSLYNSKTVRVRATLTGYHEIALYDTDCISETNFVRADFSVASREKLVDAVDALNGDGFRNGNFIVEAVLVGEFKQIQSNIDPSIALETRAEGSYSVEFQYAFTVSDVISVEPPSYHNS